MVNNRLWLSPWNLNKNHNSGFNDAACCKLVSLSCFSAISCFAQQLPWQCKERLHRSGGVSSVRPTTQDRSVTFERLQGPLLIPPHCLLISGNKSQSTPFSLPWIIRWVLWLCSDWKQRRVDHNLMNNENILWKKRVKHRGGKRKFKYWICVSQHNGRCLIHPRSPSEMRIRVIRRDWDVWRAHKQGGEAIRLFVGESREYLTKENGWGALLPTPEAEPHIRSKCTLRNEQNCYNICRIISSFKKTLCCN